MNAGVFGLVILPERASEVAVWVDLLFYALLAVSALIVIGVGLAILIFSIRYREGSQVSRGPQGEPKEQRYTIEIIWCGAALVVFLAIFAGAAVVYFRLSKPPSDAVEIQVIGKQWMWKAQHPDGRREINELHLVVNQPVKLVMTSQDVIHDFFVPAFRTKQDVLPGRYTVEWFTPTKPGDYHIFCAEYCGNDHSRMGGWVHVLTPAAHRRWLANGRTTESIVETGRRLFQARGCSGCHAVAETAPGIRPAVHAPNLAGVYGHSVALSDGQMVIADDQYLHDSILLPNKQIAAGYEPLMPTYQGSLSEEEVLQLVAYLRSLSTD